MMSTGTEPRRLGRYELQERLGRGGMAEVWKALDTQLQRHVAIKVLHPNLRTDPNFTARFEREAQLIAALHHPNIVQIYDFQVTSKSDADHKSSGELADGPQSSQSIDRDSDEPAAYMIMNYVEGPTLAQYLHATVQQGKFLSEDELLQLFSPICHGVDYAHKRGMVHRDLKPANILLDERNKENNPAGEPIISDFGISKMLNDQTQTQHGFWLGTPAYIAPEQVQGERTTAQSDIYALAIILYETCTGTLPFHADGPVALAMQHVNGTPTSPSLINPNISPALARVIMQGLEKDPTQRFTTASALLEALKDALKKPEGIPEDDSYATNIAVDAADAPTYLIPQVHAQTPPSYAASKQVSQQRRSEAHPQVPPPSIAAGETPVATGDEPTVITAPKVVQKRRKIRPLLIGLACLLIAALAGGTFLVLLRPTRPTAPVPADAGVLNFFNSGQYNQDGSAGITDEVQVDFTTLSAPDAGKAYYAWLLSDARNQHQQSLLLGKLAVNNGKGQLVFNGDQKHSNLLALYSRFALTMDSATPTQPGPKSGWRYYGEIPNIPIPSDTISHYSLLDHMRHLTSDDPIMNAIGLHGGLNLWLGRNTEKLLEAASDARDETNMPLLHRQIVRSLDYLDGEVYSKADVPAGTPFLIDPLAGQVGLLTFNEEQPLPGLLAHVGKHLAGLAEAPGVTDGQTKLANQLSQETQMIEKELASARDDAKKLVAMSDTQLGQPAAHTLLNDLYLQVNQAYVGQRDASLLESERDNARPQFPLWSGVVHSQKTPVSEYSQREVVCSPPCIAYFIQFLLRILPVRNQLFTALFIDIIFIRLVGNHEDVAGREDR